MVGKYSADLFFKTKVICFGEDSQHFILLEFARVSVKLRAQQKFPCRPAQVCVARKGVASTFVALLESGRPAHGYALSSLYHSQVNLTCRGQHGLREGREKVQWGRGGPVRRTNLGRWVEPGFRQDPNPWPGRS